MEEDPGNEEGGRPVRGLASLIGLGGVFLMSIGGLLEAGGAAAAAADRPYQDAPLAAGQSAGLLFSLPPDADKFFALLCLVILVIGFRWAGLAQRGRLSR